MMYRNLKRLLIGSLLIILIMISGCISREQEKTIPDAEIDRRVDSVLNLMTIEEKIGQLVLLTSHWERTGPVMDSNYVDLIKQGLCGNLFNAHTARYVISLQEIAVNETRMGIPLLLGYDVVHGHKTIFPIPLGEAATWDMELIEKASRVAAIEATASGLNWTFAPMVDVSRDPRWGRISESGGEDPFLGSEIARARVRGFQGDDLASPETILACVKHFAAYGAPQAGRDYHTVDMSERVLREVYLPPFKAAVETGVGSVMTSFNELDGVPVTGNEFLLKKILRDEWGFDGFVVTDYTSINEMIPHGVVSDSAEAGALALNSGVDMDLQGSIYLNYLGELLKNGDISEEQLDQSVRNVLAAKFKLGLFDDPYRYIDEERESKVLMASEHLETAREMARNSIVLLKNDSKLLPIRPGIDIAVIGYLAELKRDLLGSWKAAGEWDQMKTILEAITEQNKGGRTLYERGCGFYDRDPKNVDRAVSIAGRSDLVIMVMGEPWYWSGEAASRTSISLPEVQKKLIKKVASLDKPIVLVLLNGRPLTLEKEQTLVEAMVEAWYPGTMGADAIAEVLFGKFNPSGKLPATFPRSVGQVPIFYSVKNTGRPYEIDGPEQKYRSRYLDSPNEPLFPFGFGLSYTTFEYSDLSLNQSIMEPEDTLYVSVNLRNSGDCDGTEVVQCYIRDMVGSVTRPLKELKGFQKIHLKMGESRTVNFTINANDLAFYRKDMTFGTEPGKFMVFIGSNSRDVLETEFELIQ